MAAGISIAHADYFQIAMYREADEVAGIGYFASLLVYHADVDNGGIAAICQHRGLVRRYYYFIRFAGGGYLAGYLPAVPGTDGFQRARLVGHIPFEVPVAGHVFFAQAFPVQEQFN